MSREQDHSSQIVPDQEHDQGLLHVNSKFPPPNLPILTTAKVAAAASAPSSLTSTKAFCFTMDTNRQFLVPPVIQEKSALNSSNKVLCSQL